MNYRVRDDSTAAVNFLSVVSVCRDGWMDSAFVQDGFGRRTDNGLGFTVENKTAVPESSRGGGVNEKSRGACSLLPTAPLTGGSTLMPVGLFDRTNHAFVRFVVFSSRSEVRGTNILDFVHEVSAVVTHTYQVADTMGENGTNAPCAQKSVFHAWCHPNAMDLSALSAVL